MTIVGQIIRQAAHFGRLPLHLPLASCSTIASVQHAKSAKNNVVVMSSVKRLENAKNESSSKELDDVMLGLNLELTPHRWSLHLTLPPTTAIPRPQAIKNGWIDPVRNIAPVRSPVPVLIDMILPIVPQEKVDPVASSEVTDPMPTGVPVVEKKAVRMIIIRRKKMKKHKLLKLRKRMKYVTLKVRQRRMARKEKIFNEELLAQMSRADEFDAEAWVKEFLRKATTDPESLRPKKMPQVRPTRYVFG